MVPRWLGCGGALTRTVTVGAASMATAELIERLIVVVPFWFWKRFGSTLTEITAGVTPEEGETVTPGLDEAMLNAVWLPPGSLRVKVWVVALRAQ